MQTEDISNIDIDVQLSNCPNCGDNNSILCEIGRQTKSY